ncbi:HNH endonuclease [Fictibacillus enclensis]|uniref:HNH endonuclease n=1 Tax=Fictibacillus enclensis TaxID=1017270 RepID=UPI0025A065F9|nr:HNH endonuclease [Fictibacillus enclensis]MDM5337370.1 HNH endonuclease [Fictibacillus enclensis]
MFIVEPVTLEKELIINELENQVANVSAIKDTEREALIKTRIGQSRFKASLLSFFSECRVCGLSFESLLIASHIKPWKDCSPSERLDISNGLLLCPTHDRLFDKGFISFDSNGFIMISPMVDIKIINMLNLNDSFQLTQVSKHEKYLKWHRRYVFKKKEGIITFLLSI